MPDRSNSRIWPVATPHGIDVARAWRRGKDAGQSAIRADLPTVATVKSASVRYSSGAIFISFRSFGGPESFTMFSSTGLPVRHVPLAWLISCGIGPDHLVGEGQVHVGIQVHPQRHRRLARVTPGDDHPAGGGVVFPGLGHPGPDLLLERAVVSHAMSSAAMLPRAPIAWLGRDRSCRQREPAALVLTASSGLLLPSWLRGSVGLICRGLVRRRVRTAGVQWSRERDSARRGTAPGYRRGA